MIIYDEAFFAKMVDCFNALDIFSKTPSQMSDQALNTPLVPDKTCVDSTQIGTALERFHIWKMHSRTPKLNNLHQIQPHAI